MEKTGIMIRAHLTVNPHDAVGTIDRRLFGGFVEHLGRHIYDGIYEPAHPTAGPDGFRRDVIELVKELGISAVRYPGGNFVSGYKWEDGVGPREQRPRRLDLAWHSTETNEIGLDEFAIWLRKVGSELVYAVNLGTRGVLEALEVLEYANIASGTTLSDSRARNGHVEPHGIRMWCLGNEMDGPWQLGHGTAHEYGALALKTARAMRQVDPTLELVACGSSGAQMPTFGTWEREVLEQTYEEVDFISCHAYYEPVDGDLDSFLASAANMDLFIDSVAATADHVKATLHSDKVMKIAFDEWNVWYQSRYKDVDRITDPQEWPVAPRLLEDSYTVIDAVVFGNLMISLLRHADRVASASLAQLVNVIAPIMTEPKGPAWRQTTFHPFAITSRLALGQSIPVAVDCPSVDTAKHGTVPLVDAVATLDATQGKAAIFLVNRSQTDDVQVQIDVSALGAMHISETHTLHDQDIHAANTLADPDRVVPHPNESASLKDGTFTITLPAVSWTAVSLTDAEPAQ